MFTDSAAALLLGLTAALWISNQASADLALPSDPILGISMRTTFWLAGAIALVIAVVCLRGKQVQLKAGLILWLAVNLVVYQAGVAWSGGQGGMEGYLGSIASTFDLSPKAVSVLLKVVSAYLLLGSLLTLLRFWREKAQGYLKAICASCGGHIAFAPGNLGQKISCPHCEHSLTLRRPEENLKMSCYFCHEHIEFPQHALGTKMPCPHCKKDITLKEPA